jgi:hypothetical protein
MKISRRKALSLIAGAPAFLSHRKPLAEEVFHGRQDNLTAIASPGNLALQITPGPFQGTRESLLQWQVPD